MFKFGMSEYEVNQNIVGVAIANFVVIGAIGGFACAAAAAGVVYGLYRVFS